MLTAEGLKIANIVLGLIFAFYCVVATWMGYKLHRDLKQIVEKAMYKRTGQIMKALGKNLEVEDFMKVCRVLNDIGMIELMKIGEDAE